MDDRLHDQALAEASRLADEWHGRCGFDSAVERVVFEHLAAVAFLAGIKAAIAIMRETYGRETVTP